MECKPVFESYNDFIDKNKIIDDNIEKYEIHHIIPKFNGGTDNETNLCKLSVKNHFLAHYIYAKETNSQKAWGTVWLMLCTRRNEWDSNNPLLGAEIYEEIRNHYITDYLKDDEHKNNLSIASKKRVSTEEGRKELLYSLECARKAKINNKDSSKKVSESIKKSWKNPNTRKKHLDALKKFGTVEFYNKRRNSILKAYKNPEALKRKSEAMKKCWNTPEMRLKRSLIMKEYWKRKKENGSDEKSDKTNI